MKKTPLVSNLIILLFFCLLGYFYFTEIEPLSVKKQKDKPQAINQNINNTNTFTDVLIEAITSEKTIECYYESDAIRTGKAYIKNKQFYFISSVEGNLVKSIAKEKCIWIWEDNNFQGVKMCFDKEFWESPSEQNYGLIPNDSKFSCNAANLDDGLFSPPQSVNFIDVTDQNNNIPSTTNP